MNCYILQMYTYKNRRNKWRNNFFSYLPSGKNSCFKNILRTHVPRKTLANQQIFPYKPTLILCFRIIYAILVSPWYLITTLSSLGLHFPLREHASIHSLKICHLFLSQRPPCPYQQKSGRVESKYANRFMTWRTLCDVVGLV